MQLRIRVQPVLLRRFNPDGTLKWSCVVDRSIISSPAIAADGTLYVAAGSWKGTLYALRSTSYGLDDGPWPMFGRDLSHSRRAR